MAQADQIRGADPVNDEFEVGYDERFEKSWFRAELIGRTCLGIIAVAGLAGLLGRGPYSHHVATSPGGLLSVDYEPVARANTATVVTVTIRRLPGDAGDPVPLVLSDTFIGPLGLERILPQPVSEATEADGIAIRIAIVQAADATGTVHLQLLPSVPGRFAFTIRIGQRDAVTARMFVLP